MYISTYIRLPGARGEFGVFKDSGSRGVRGPGLGVRGPGSPGPCGPGTGVPTSGSGIPAMFEATIADKSRCHRLLNRMIASRSPSASIWTPTWPHLGFKIGILCGRGCIFEQFTDLCLKTPKMASIWPRQAPRAPIKAPRDPQELLKVRPGRPRGVQGVLQIAPRWLQAGPKSFPGRCQAAAFSSVLFKPPKKAPKTPPPDPPWAALGRPKMLQETPTRAPRASCL